MRVLICGNIVWSDAKPIFDTMYSYTQELGPSKCVFISGMAPGADYIAYVLTHALDAKCDEYPWNSEGAAKAKRVARMKGVKFDERAPRNQWMLDSGVDVCFAYAEDLPGPWSGTRDMVNRCLEKGGIPVFWMNGTDVFEVISDDRDTHEMTYVTTTLVDAIRDSLPTE